MSRSSWVVLALAFHSRLGVDTLFFQRDEASVPAAPVPSCTARVDKSAFCELAKASRVGDNPTEQLVGGYRLLLPDLSSFHSRLRFLGLFIYKLRCPGSFDADNLISSAYRGNIRRLA